MPALVETMAYRMESERDRAWHGLGVTCDHAMSSEEALKLSGLDWEVIPQDVITKVGKKEIVIPNTKANIRNTDGSVLGIVTNKYRIVQNTEAFKFTDSLVGEGITYETAGSLMGGRKIWLLARLPEQVIVNDQYIPYLCFVNSHDGKGSVRASLVTVRVICNNTLNLALSSAPRSWSIRHSSKVEARLQEAHKTLFHATAYMDKFKVEAEKMASIKISKSQYERIVEKLFVIDDDMSDREKKNKELLRQGAMEAYAVPDLNNIRGTAWGALSAISDFVYHKKPQRESQTYKERKMLWAVMGNPILDQAKELLLST